MRIALLLACCLTLPGLVEKDTLIIYHKEIIVKGKTSVGSFECSYDSQYGGDTLVFNRPSPVNSSLDFEIPVKDFGCGNFLLNHDFRKTLKAEEYPTCAVSVDRLSKVDQQIFGTIRVRMAGTDLCLEKVSFAQREGRLQGNIRLSMDQLGLDASSRLGGLVQVNEQIDLEINLYLEPS